ncbi:cytochrome c-550 PedF [Methylobacterium oxalidis]|uniref:cytochrome c-550 PedF n=1 Tax=Methylobacterium oxalidis TaxID=944322 RepID=UPI003315A7FC
MRTVPRLAGSAALALGLALSAQPVLAHGDVQPQPVDTTGLEPLGDEWRSENPYRGNAKAIAIGDSGYNQNCARCHGLQVISGGLAPDLRYLEKGQEGDTWFQERVRHGALINGVAKMPAFEGVLSQEALWAIRSYLEAKHEE